MQCLVAAVRPLQVRELAEVLVLNFDAEGIPKLNSNWRWEDQEGAVLLACSSLVTIVNDGDSRIVQFSHFSVKEFLTSDRLAEPIRDVSCYNIGLEAAHTILAQASLGYLLQLDDRVNRDNIKGFPLALYSAQYWATHARFGNVSSRIKDWMESLFDEDKPHFATWLWIYDNDLGVSSITMLPEKPRAVPLYHATSLGFRDLAKHLIAEHPEHINAGDEFAPIHVAAKRGHVDILALLLEHGVYVDSRNAYGQTPLSWAAVHGRVDVGQYLLDRGADINARNNNPATPLSWAVSYGHVGFVRMLLERGARIDVGVGRGRTPLHLAVEGGSIQIARLLMEHGADVNAREVLGMTPSQLAMQQEILELFSEYGSGSV